MVLVIGMVYASMQPLNQFYWEGKELCYQLILCLPPWNPQVNLMNAWPHRGKCKVGRIWEKMSSPLNFWRNCHRRQQVILSCIRTGGVAGIRPQLHMKKAAVTAMPSLILRGLSYHGLSGLLDVIKQRMVSACKECSRFLHWLGHLTKCSMNWSPVQLWDPMGESPEISLLCIT